MRTAILLVIIAASLPCSASAQRTAEAFLDERTYDDTLRVSGEMDPALAFGVGYVRAVSIDVDRFSRRLGVRVDVTAIMGGSSWDVGAGAAMALFEGPVGPNVVAAADLELKIAQNDVHTALVYGYGVALRPGYFDPVWYLAAEASVRGTIASTFIHRDAYRNEVADVRDGTYVTGQAALYVGGAFGFCIERVFLVGARFAWRLPITFESYAPWYQPYTIDLDLGWRF